MRHSVGCGSTGCSCGLRTAVVWVWVISQSIGWRAKAWATKRTKRDKPACQTWQTSVLDMTGGRANQDGLARGAEWVRACDVPGTIRTGVRSFFSTRFFQKTGRLILPIPKNTKVISEMYCRGRAFRKINLPGTTLSALVRLSRKRSTALKNNRTPVRT